MDRTREGMNREYERIEGGRGERNQRAREKMNRGCEGRMGP